MAAHLQHVQPAPRVLIANNVLLPSRDHIPSRPVVFLCILPMFSSYVFSLMFSPYVFFPCFLILFSSRVED